MNQSRTMKKFRQVLGMAGFLAFHLLLTACGGSSSDGDGDDPVSGFDARVWSIVPANDGSGDIYVGGEFTGYRGISRKFIARINANGSLDSGFNPGAGFNGLVQSIALATDGSGDSYAGGNFTNYRGNLASRIARINNDASIDAGFNSGFGFDTGVNALALATDGSGDIYAGGRFFDYFGNARMRIARINSDGSNDPGFDSGTGFNQDVLPITPATDGSGDIYVGGVFTTYRGISRDFIARINSDGSNDAGFDVGLGFNNVVWSITPANDGSGDIYVGGHFTIYDGNVTNRIVRINSDGSIDPGFDSGTGFDGTVHSITPATDGSGDIYVGGSFTDYDGNARSNIARINSNGSNDAGFASGAGFDGAVRVIATANDASGDIYVGGDFLTYQSVTANHFVRLDSTGTQN